VAPFTTPLQEGHYTITEELQAGWRQAGSSGDCDFTVDYPADQSRTFSCTFNNEQLGRIIIRKLTDPPNTEQSFAFTLTGGPSSLNQSFSLKDGESHDSGYLRAGSGYAAGETVPAGWDQSSASCDDGSPVGNIAVSPGETVTCTFANTERGLIIVKKVTVPAQSAQSFAFTLGGGPSALAQSFSLTGGTSHESGFVRPGTGYAAAETVWDQTSATCDDGSPVDDIDLSPGETVTCTFHNEQLGRILVEKLTDPANADQSFAFSLEGGSSEFDQSFSLSDGETHDSGYVQAGSGYAAAEVVPEGWDQSAASCDDGSPVEDIDVSPGEVVTCRFANTQRGLIVVKKITSPTSGSQPFAFTLGGGPSALSQSFSLTGGGSHESGFVKPGAGYAVSETVPADWTQTSALCDDGSPVSNVDVSPAEIVTCTFTNTAKPNGITLDKKVNGGDHATSADALLAHVSDPLTYTVVITNNGQVPLTMTALSDSLYPALVAACPQGVGSVLAPGASFTCTYQVGAGDDAHNVAAVLAVDSIGRPVSDSDETFVDVIHPAISIVKTADPVLVSEPGSVTYTYLVTNTGDTTLRDVLVTDDILGAIGSTGSLAPGESVTMAKTVDVDSSTPPRNIGTVNGTDVLGQTVSANDDAIITVVLAEIVELPRTGAPLGTEARAGLLLLQVGLVLHLLARRRRSEAGAG
jgi:uncharacterized repeat protein (TIGR01451 family)